MSAGDLSEDCGGIEECQGLSDHYHCARCGEASNIMCHPYSCPTPKDSRAVERIRKYQLTILVERYKRELRLRDDNASAIKTFIIIRRLATVEELHEIQEKTSNTYQDE